MTPPKARSRIQSTSAIARQGLWEIIGAVLGRDTFLVGRSPRNPNGEALVLAPPGVRIPAVAGSGEQVSTRGWRVALWPCDEEGHLHVDVGRPTWACEVSLAYVVGLVELECPSHLTWVADRIERQLLNARIAETPDEDGVVFSFASGWKRDAEAVLEELEIALSPDAARGKEVEDGELGNLLPDLKIAAPRDPGKYEPRLTRGWMRRFYDGLTGDLPASSPDGYWN